MPWLWGLKQWYIEVIHPKEPSFIYHQPHRVQSEHDVVGVYSKDETGPQLLIWEVTNSVGIILLLYQEMLCISIVWQDQKYKSKTLTCRSINEKHFFLLPSLLTRSDRVGVVWTLDWEEGSVGNLGGAGLIPVLIWTCVLSCKMTSKIKSHILLVRAKRQFWFFFSL